MKRLLGITLTLALMCVTVLADGPGEGGGAPVIFSDGVDVVSLLITDTVSFVGSLF